MVPSASLASDTSRFVGVGLTPFLGAVVGVRNAGSVRLAVGSGVGVSVAVGTDVYVG